MSTRDEMVQTVAEEIELGGDADSIVRALEEHGYVVDDRPFWLDKHAAAVLSSAAAALERVRLHNPGVDVATWLSRRAQHIRNGDIDA